jgi:hypothetical protein
MTRRTRKKTLEGQRFCSICELVLPIEQFHWRNKKINIRRNICKDCRNQQKWFSSRVELERQKLLAAQQGKCAICQVDHEQSKLGVDHNHKTFEVRGLLCLDCNTGIANFEDNPKFLIQAVIYLNGGQNAKTFSISSISPNYDFEYHGGVSELRKEIG